MRTIRIVVDEPLLKAADKVAETQGVTLSVLIREALCRYLREVQRREFVERDREGYLKHPDTENDLQDWENVAAWPRD